MRIQIKKRDGLPLLILLMTIIASTHSSIHTIVFRYSVNYTIFLGLMLTWVVIAFRITRDEKRFSCLLKHIGKIPRVPLLVITITILSISGFLVEDIDTLTHFLYINISVAGIVIAGSSIIFMLILSREQWKSELSNYALLLSSCLAAFLLFEAGVRINGLYNDRHLFEHIAQHHSKPAPMEKVTLGEIIQVSENPRIVYELIPNISVMFQKQPVKIGPNGFRGKIIPQKPSDICIVGLGDSIMFGWGVKEHERYLNVLSELLAARYPNNGWNVINTAVPGYNTVMEIETLKEKGLQYNPDLVIINFVGNDIDLPNFIRKKENYFSWRKSFLKEQVTRFTRKSERKSNIGLAVAPFDDVQEWRFEGNPIQVPEAYRDMVGEAAYEKAMQELKVLSKQYQFDVVVLSHWQLRPFVKKICAELGFPTVETFPKWEEYITTHSITNPESAWQVFKGDPHPSVIGNKVIATALFEYFVNSKQFSQLNENLANEDPL